MVQETKGDTVAPGAEGLLNVQPDDFVFYVGGYPSNFTVSLAGLGVQAALPACPRKSCSVSDPKSPLGSALTVHCAHSPPNPYASPATGAALNWTRSTRRWSVSTTSRKPSSWTQLWTSLVPGTCGLSQPSLRLHPPSADPPTSDWQLQVNGGPMAHRWLLPGRLRFCPHQHGEPAQQHQTLRPGAATRVLQRHHLLPAASGMSAVHAPLLSSPTVHAPHLACCPCPCLPAVHAPIYYPCPCLPAVHALSPVHLAVLTLPFPQDQFLCLAVQEGKLVLLYDFGAGLKEANPLQQPPPQLTATSKAVRLGSVKALGGEGQWGLQLP